MEDTNYIFAGEMRQHKYHTLLHTMKGEEISDGNALTLFDVHSLLTIPGGSFKAAVVTLVIMD